MVKKQMKIYGLILLIMLVGSSVLHVEASSDEQTENSGAGVEFDREEEERPPKEEGKPKPGPGGGDGEVWSKLPQTGQVEKAKIPVVGAIILAGTLLAFFTFMKLKRE